MAAVSLLPMSLNAQQTSDDFFRNDEINNNGWRDAITFTGISNYGIGETVSVGGGLLILAGLGAGYAVARRKRKINSRKGVSLFLAFTLLLGLTQCKKNVEQIVPNAGNDNGAYITLNVGDGSKVNVTPGYEDPNTHQIYARVEFEEDDQIYVVYRTNHVGTLTYDGAKFAGTISATPAAPAIDDTQLEFYFIGGKGFTVVNNAGTPKKFELNISDQSAKYPVISYGKSNELFNNETTNYTAKLENKCSIVKFTTDKDYGTGLAITNMNNKVVVDISDGSFTYTKTNDGDGVVKLHYNATKEFWGVLLPQNEVTNAKALAPGMASLGNITVPEIGVNQYISTGVSVEDLTRVFTILDKNTNNGYEQVMFAPGNLQNISGTWKFADNQWEVLGNSVSGGTDLFTWNGYDGYKTTLGSYWKTMSSENGYYLLTGRTNAWSICCINYVTTPSTGGDKGLVLFPDNWDGSLLDPSFVYSNKYYNFTGNEVMPEANRFNSSKWSELENAGCVFLPTAGQKPNNSSTAQWMGSYAYYWLSNQWDSNNGYCLLFNHNNLNYEGTTNKGVSSAIRPVRVLNTAKVTW